MPPEGIQVSAPGILTVFQWRAKRVLGGVSLRPDGVAAFIQSRWTFRKRDTRWGVGGHRATNMTSKASFDSSLRLNVLTCDFEKFGLLSACAETSSSFILLLSTPAHRRIQTVRNYHHRVQLVLE